MWGQHSTIDGGITNLLWKVLPPEESGLGPVVVRVFGEETDRLIDRERELRLLLQMSEAGFGARVRVSVWPAAVVTLAVKYGLFLVLTTRVLT